MKVPLADDGWELEPDQAHPNAKALLTEDFFWCATNDYAPCGNDDGADALSFYLKAHTTSEPINAFGFISDSFEANGFTLEPWPLDIDHMNCSIEASTQLAMAVGAHDWIIGTAFAMYFVHGWIDSDFRDFTLEMTQRQRHWSPLTRCGYPDERIRTLDLIDRALGKMETTPPNIG